MTWRDEITLSLSVEKLTSSFTARPSCSFTCTSFWSAFAAKRKKKDEICWADRNSVAANSLHHLGRVPDAFLWRQHQDLVSSLGGGGGKGLPYMGYIGMCRCEGYVFQAVDSSIGYINHSVWVYNRLSFSRNWPVGGRFYLLRKPFGEFTLVKGSKIKLKLALV